MRLIYYIFLLPLSYLPFGLLNILSFKIRVILFGILNYRHKVIINNVRNSFPNTPEKEIKRIASRFKTHLADIFTESIKIFSISKKQAYKRMVCVNPELPNRFFSEGKNIILVGGHYNNWELYAVALKNHLNFDTYAIYKPLSNQFMDKKMRKTRGKFGLELIPMKWTKKYFSEITSTPRAIIFAADQSPSNPKRCYFTNFLNQDTAVQFGVEKYAKEYNWPVVYGEIRKIKRGYYEVEYKVISENPSELEYGEITELHTKALENSILKAPEYWLWSHRRWKHKRPEND